MDEHTNDQQGTVEQVEPAYTTVSNPRRVRL
jgi:hypothetical protein